MGSKIFEESIKNISPEIKIFSEILLDISDQINEYLKEKGMSQKDLAQKLGKKEAEISKWMSGSHNFTMRTISKISAVLERPILTTLLYVDELPEEEKEYILGKLAKPQVEDLHRLEIPKTLSIQNIGKEHLNNPILQSYKYQSIKINHA